MRYEKVNLKTQIYNQNVKVDNMIKNLSKPTVKAPVKDKKGNDSTAASKQELPYVKPLQLDDPMKIYEPKM